MGGDLRLGCACYARGIHELLSQFQRLGRLVRFFFSGAGVIVLFGVVIRLLLLQHRRSVVGHVICGLVLLSLGLGDQVDWDWVWPSVMIAVAVVILQDASYRKPGLHALCGGSLKSPNTKDERETWHG